MIKKTKSNRPIMILIYSAIFVIMLTFSALGSYAAPAETTPATPTTAPTTTASVSEETTPPNSDTPDEIVVSSEPIIAIESETKTPSGATPPHTATGSITANDFVFEDTQTGKQFVTITTASGKVFYLIIDHDKTNDNVYLLTEVGEADLLNFAEAKQTLTVNNPDKTLKPTQTNPIDNTPQEEAPAKQNNSGLIVIILLVLGGGVAAFYFFKVKKGGIKKPAGNFDFDDDYDENEQEDEE